MLYIFTAILGPPKYNTFSTEIPTAINHKKQTMSIIDLDVTYNRVFYLFNLSPVFQVQLFSLELHVTCESLIMNITLTKIKKSPYP